MIANEYMKDKEKFLPFIKKEEQKIFMIEYAHVFQEVGDEDDTVIASRLLNWEQSGYVMMLLNVNTDWSSVYELLHSQGHSESSLIELSAKILNFSPYGFDFLEHLRGGIRKQICSSKKSSTSRRKKSTKKQ